MTTLTTEQGTEFMNNLVVSAEESLMTGILKKNISRGFVNMGISDDTANQILRKALFGQRDWAHYQAK